jgi:hypothetical protein
VIGAISFDKAFSCCKTFENARSLSSTYYVLVNQREKYHMGPIIRCSESFLQSSLLISNYQFLGTISILVILYCILASIFVSLYAIYIKRILPLVDNNVWLLTFCNKINATFLFLPLMLVTGEFPVILAFSGLNSVSFWSLMTISAIFGWAIGYASGLQVKVLDPHRV